MFRRPHDQTTVDEFVVPVVKKGCVTCFKVFAIKSNLNRHTKTFRRPHGQAPVDEFVVPVVKKVCVRCLQSKVIEINTLKRFRDHTAKPLLTNFCSV